MENLVCNSFPDCKSCHGLQNSSKEPLTGNLFFVSNSSILRRTFNTLNFLGIELLRFPKLYSNFCCLYLPSKMVLEITKKCIDLVFKIASTLGRSYIFIYIDHVYNMYMTLIMFLNVCLLESTCRISNLGRLHKSRQTS